MYTQFFLLFAMIFTGYFLRKINLITVEMIGGLNKFTLYFAFPCMLIYNVGILEVNKNLIQIVTVMFVLSCVMYGIYAVVARGYTKLRKFPERIRNVAELSMTSPNNGFMGFPISIIFFGQMGMLLMAVNNAAFNIYIFTYGLLRMRSKDKEKMHWVKITIRTITNPILLGLIIGFVISGLKISLENPVGKYFEIMGSIATPVAMIMIGATLAGSKFLEMFKNHIVWESALMKVAGLAALTYGLLLFLPVAPLVKAILVLSMAMPTAATVTMLAEQEGQNKELASKILFFGTVLSMGTIPLIVGIL